MIEDLETTKREYIICKETGKRCYTQSLAGKQIGLAKGKYRRKKAGNGKIPQRSYYCNYCGYYHLTSLKSFTNKKRYIKNIYK